MNCEKNSHCEKCNFESIGNSAPTIYALGKGLLGRFYLCVKEYITLSNNMFGFLRFFST